MLPIDPISHFVIITVINKIDLLFQMLLLFFRLKLFNEISETDEIAIHRLGLTNRRIKTSTIIMNIFVSESLLLRIFTYIKSKWTIFDFIFFHNISYQLDSSTNDEIDSVDLLVLFIDTIVIIETFLFNGIVIH